MSSDRLGEIAVSMGLQGVALGMAASEKEKGGRKIKNGSAFDDLAEATFMSVNDGYEETMCVTEDWSARHKVLEVILRKLFNHMPDFDTLVSDLYMHGVINRRERMLFEIIGDMLNVDQPEK